VASGRLRVTRMRGRRIEYLLFLEAPATADEA
jgi:hypothetical protein